MDQKPKVGGAKKKAKPKEKDEKQFERFIETVQALDVDETGESFDKAFTRIVLPKN